MYNSFLKKNRGRVCRVWLTSKFTEPELYFCIKAMPWLQCKVQDAQTLLLKPDAYFIQNVTTGRSEANQTVRLGISEFWGANMKQIDKRQTEEIL